MRQRVVANIAAGAPQGLELGQRSLGPRPGGDEARGNVGERALQRLIGERRRDARLECRCARHDAPRAAACAMGGALISPASTSAT